MSAKIIISDFGPVKNTEITINNYIVLTGPQACGKSTIAKVVYFFMTVRNDFISQFSTLQSKTQYEESTAAGMNKRLRSKFLGIFGSPLSLEEDMRISCEYTKDIYVSVFLKKDSRSDDKNYITFSYSKQLQDVMKDWDEERSKRTEADSYEDLLDRFSTLFDIDFETIYIPAGRSMITLLTDQLSYIFATTEGQSQRSIDYCTKDYVARILKLRPEFANGLDGAVNDKKYLTSEVIDFGLIDQIKTQIREILKGKYAYQSGEERLILKTGKFVKINYASSGQQEIVWVLNIIFHHILEKKKVFLVLEEPEAHLYPDSQKKIAELLSMFGNLGNMLLITTHSPYILGQINNMLLAGQVVDNPRIEEVVGSLQILDKEAITAFYVNDGATYDAFDEGLINNTLIDGASKDINEQSDRILELIWEKQNCD